MQANLQHPIVDSTYARREARNESSYVSTIDGLCIRALSLECEAWPKPGLVTPVDSGSHDDMDIHTFHASIAALKGSFAQLCTAGSRNADLIELQSIGLDAEASMLRATGGVNTHRGAIFCLGLLAAAAGLRWRYPAEWGECTLGEVVSRRWGSAILASRPQQIHSHGHAMYQQHAVGGARSQAAAGFPLLFNTALPALRHYQANDCDEMQAFVGALLALMAEAEDSNVVWRGGLAGLQLMHIEAAAFNAAGGVMQPQWQQALLAMHQAFVERRLSPGGCADLAGAAWFVNAVK